jgi:NADP-dependent aldehyde dehydrogenase
MNLHGQSFLGDRLGARAGATFQATSPLDRAPLPPPFFLANEQDVSAALELAESAFAQFRTTTGEQRAGFLERIADEIAALGDALIARAHQETGLPEARLTGERTRTINQLKLFAQVAREGSWVDARIDHAIPNRQPVPKPDLRRMFIPIGPVVVFGSSNFPLAFSVAGGDTASALATGNPVVVKAHSGHPGTSELAATAIRKAVSECNLPSGVFSMLQGSGKVTGLALVKHPITRAVGFTGSRTAGRALFDAAAARPDPIPVFAEMSSLNPIFILPEAMRERGARIAEGLRASVTMGVGQFCTKPGLVFGLQSTAFTEFQGVLARELENVAPATMLHSGIYDAYQKRLARVSSVDGVKIAARSREPGDGVKTHGEAALLCTHATNFRKHPELAEEVFGPSTLLIVAQTIDELMGIAGDLEGQLTATVHGTPDDLAKAGPLLSILERKAGRLLINGFPTGVEVCPSMNHGGPYPATTDVRFTSVGTAALYRFVRPICYQDFPGSLLPDALKEANPLGIHRIIDGKFN